MKQLATHAGKPAARRRPGRLLALTLILLGLALALPAAPALASTTASGILSTLINAQPLSPLGEDHSVSAQPSASRPAVAPLNPAFTAHLKLRSIARYHGGLEPWGLGFIPSPVDFSYLRNARVRLGVSAYPSSYDLRALEKLSPVEDQGQYGTCWAFAALGSLESCLLPAERWVFSEDNLVLNAGFDGDPYN